LEKANVALAKEKILRTGKVSGSTRIELSRKELTIIKISKAYLAVKVSMQQLSIAGRAIFQVFQIS